jgi:hypothetical protein
VTVRRVGERLLPQIEPAPGREHTHFATTQSGDELLVVPDDAWAEVRAGRLDRRLFDVAALLRDGYGDTGRADIPLIVHGAAAALNPADAITLSTMDIKIMRQPKETASDFWNSVRHKGVLAQSSDRIWLDGLRKPSLDKSAPQVGAPAAWRAGLTGKDVPVAARTPATPSATARMWRPSSPAPARRRTAASPGWRRTPGC